MNPIWHEAAVHPIDSSSVEMPAHGFKDRPCYH